MKVRFVSLVENGTPVLFGSRMGSSATDEGGLFQDVLPFLKPGMVCLADRNFYSYQNW